MPVVAQAHPRERRRKTEDGKNAKAELANRIESAVARDFEFGAYADDVRASVSRLLDHCEVARRRDGGNGAWLIRQWVTFAGAREMGIGGSAADECGYNAFLAATGYTIALMEELEASIDVFALYPEAEKKLVSHYLRNSSSSSSD